MLGFRLTLQLFITQEENPISHPPSKPDFLNEARQVLVEPSANAYRTICDKRKGPHTESSLLMPFTDPMRINNKAAELRFD
jgi:hypothetical protein